MSYNVQNFEMRTLSKVATIQIQKDLPRGRFTAVKNTFQSGDFHMRKNLHTIK